MTRVDSTDSSRVDAARSNRWFYAALGLLTLLALARGFGLVLHKPLLAFANNFDQIRFTACIDVGPNRPGVPPERNNPQAPLRYFSFFPLPADACYWTSDLAFTAPTALVWRADERLTGADKHSVRDLGVLRMLAWCIAGAWVTRAWLKAGSRAAALANVVWLALVGFDPANTLYLDAFYAEPTSLLALYLCVAGAALAQATQSRSALLVTLLGACLLATSKFQHLALPACFAFVLLLFVRTAASRRIALVLLLGSVVGGSVVAINRVYSASLMQSLSATNGADFILSALLLNVDDPTATAGRLGLAPDCAARANIGGVYGLHAPFEKVCPGIGSIPTRAAWGELVSQPRAFVRLLARVPTLMLPWIPSYLGVVEGGQFAKLPARWPSLSDAIGDSAVVAGLLLLLPWITLALARRAPADVRTHLTICAVATTAVPLIALFGDGYIDFPKHTHLVFSAALASLCVPLAYLLTRFLAPQDQANEHHSSTEGPRDV